MSNKLIKDEYNPETSLLTSITQYLNHLVNICIWIFMILVIVVMPFYYDSLGYAHMGSAKCDYWTSLIQTSSRIMLPTLSAQLLLCALSSLSRTRSLSALAASLFKSFSVTDLLVLGYGLVNIISFLGSEYKSEAFLGLDTWRMGFLSQLVFTVMYFLISRACKKPFWLGALFLPVTGIVFLLGYINRFSIDPLSLYNGNPLAISTIGNINWYCGYMVTILFGGVYLLWNSSFTGKRRIPIFLYTTVGLASLVTQGSSSGILTLAVILFVLFLLSVSDERRMKSYFEIVLLLSGVCLFTLLIRVLAPGSLIYQEASTDLLTLTPLPAVMGAAAAVLRLWLGQESRKGRYPVKVFHILGCTAAAAAFVCALGYLALLVLNTIKPGSIGPLSRFSFFTFNYSWGSMRGATWIAGLASFRDQNLWQKFFGVGQDSMASFIYSHGSPSLLNMLHTQFPGLRLTNAHNEWITLLVNTGLLGLLTFAGTTLTAAFRYLRAGFDRTRPYYYITGACGLNILAYIIHNTVSFQQVMNGPVLFIMLGIGEACLKSFRQAHDSSR